MIFFVYLVACAEGHCRKVENLENSQKINQPNSTAPAGSNSENESKRVLVYKDDGSLQCSKKKGKSPQEMAKELAPEVQSFSQSKRSDGLMHIQVCGQKTGQVNVFEILESDLAKAQRKSFKLWNLD